MKKLSSSEMKAEFEKQMPGWKVVEQKRAARKAVSAAHHLDGADADTGDEETEEQQRARLIKARALALGKPGNNKPGKDVGAAAALDSLDVEDDEESDDEDEVVLVAAEPPGKKGALDRSHRAKTFLMDKGSGKIVGGQG